MKPCGLTRVGKVVKTHGYQGAVVLNAYPGTPPLKISEPVFVTIDGRPVPFFLEECKRQGHAQWIIKTDDIHSEGEARMLLQKEVSICSPAGKIRTVEPTGFDGLLGFRIMDMQRGEIGPLLDVIERPKQPLLVVLYQEKEVLIPLAEDFIDSVDESKQLIYMHLPEGLLDL